VGTDKSREAVALARANVHRHGLADRVTVCHGDLLEPVRAPLISSSRASLTCRPGKRRTTPTSLASHVKPCSRTGTGSSRPAASSSAHAGGALPRPEARDGGINRAEWVADPMAVATSRSEPSIKRIEGGSDDRLDHLRCRRLGLYVVTHAREGDPTARPCPKNLSPNLRAAKCRDPECLLFQRISVLHTKATTASPSVVGRCSAWIRWVAICEEFCWPSAAGFASPP
jgi:hypothetical protein